MFNPQILYLILGTSPLVRGRGHRVLAGRNKTLYVRTITFTTVFNARFHLAVSSKMILRSGCNRRYVMDEFMLNRMLLCVNSCEIKCDFGEAVENQLGPRSDS